MINEAKRAEICKEFAQREKELTILNKQVKEMATPYVQEALAIWQDKHNELADIVGDPLVLFGRSEYEIRDGYFRVFEDNRSDRDYPEYLEAKLSFEFVFNVDGARQKFIDEADAQIRLTKELYATNQRLTKEII